MRLDANQIDDILKTTRSLFYPFEDFSIFLYGSRANPNLKGGDIDLVIISKDEVFIKKFQEAHLDLLVNLKKNSSIGQRKIDIKAVSKMEFESNPFWVSVSENCIELKSSSATRGT